MKNEKIITYTGLKRKLESKLVLFQAQSDKLYWLEKKIG